MLRQKANDPNGIACNDNGWTSVVEQDATPISLGILTIATELLGAVCLHYVADRVLIISRLPQQHRVEGRWSGARAIPDHRRLGREIARRSLMLHQPSRIIAEG